MNCKKGMIVFFVIVFVLFELSDCGGMWKMKRGKSRRKRRRRARKLRTKKNRNEVPIAYIKASSLP